MTMIKDKTDLLRQGLDDDFNGAELSDIIEILQGYLDEYSGMYHRLWFDLAGQYEGVDLRLMGKREESKKERDNRLERELIAIEKKRTRLQRTISEAQEKLDEIKDD